MPSYKQPWEVGLLERENHFTYKNYLLAKLFYLLLDLQLQVHGTGTQSPISYKVLS
jgi:hypothetical protein